MAVSEGSVTHLVEGLRKEGKKKGKGRSAKPMIQRRRRKIEPTSEALEMSSRRKISLLE
jgi:hypothetical protein